MGSKDITTPKEQILKKIRQALIHKTLEKFPNIDLDSSVYSIPNAPRAETFVKEYTHLGGEFIYCHNRFDFIDNFLKLIEANRWKNVYCSEEGLKEELKDCNIPFTDELTDGKIKVSLTSCEALIARTGSIVVSSQKNTRTLPAYSDIHLVVAKTSQIVKDIKDALLTLKNKYGEAQPSMISFISGPCRTNAIEAQFTPGGMAPLQLYLFLIDDSE